MEKPLTELEQHLVAQLNLALNHIEFLVDYGRRVAQRQVTRNDAERVTDARMFVATMRHHQQANSNGGKNG